MNSACFRVRVNDGKSEKSLSDGPSPHFPYQITSHVAEREMGRAKWTVSVTFVVILSSVFSHSLFFSSHSVSPTSPLSSISFILSSRKYYRFLSPLIPKLRPLTMPSEHQNEEPPPPPMNLPPSCLKIRRRREQAPSPQIRPVDTALPTTATRTTASVAIKVDLRRRLPKPSALSSGAVPLPPRLSIPAFTSSTRSPVQRNSPANRESTECIENESPIRT